MSRSLPVPGYGDSVELALDAIGSPTGAPGSGSAAALALSVAVECLALHASLTRRVLEDPGRLAELEALEARIEGWRRDARMAFREDAERVGRMVEARRRRDASEGADRDRAVEDEVAALEEATLGLVELVELAHGVGVDAERLLRGQGAGHARSESETARALAEAVATSAQVMIEANVATLAGRDQDRAPIRAALERLGDATRPYEPIDCSIHDRLEDAAIRRRPFRIRYRTHEGAAEEVTATIEDLWTRAGAEFARLGTGAIVRLDRMEAIEPDVGSAHG